MISIIQNKKLLVLAATLALIIGSFLVFAPKTKAGDVVKTNPTIVTEVHNSSEAVVTSVPAGTSVHDKATVTGSGPTPTGTVAFLFFNGSTCNADRDSFTSAGIVALDASGVAHPSLTEGPLSPGTYTFKAHYNGDANYNIYNGSCETFTVFEETTPPEGTLSGVKFNDLNNNGAFDGTDAPLPGVTINLTGPVNTSAVTQADGSYSFSSLPDGTYTICETVPVGYAQTFPATNTGGCSGSNGYSVTVLNGINNPLGSLDFGNTQNATLTLVKNLINDNGGLKTINDFPLTATGPTTVSGVSGTATVTGAVVGPGTYTLSEVTQSGYAASLWTCTNGVVVTSAQITLAPGQITTCTVTNNDNPLTRTLGYWSTHLTQANTWWASVAAADKNICSHNPVTAGTTAASSNVLMGGFWSNISKKTTGTNRTALDQAKMQMVQQYLAAALNKSAFGTSDGGLLAAARAACTGGVKATILTVAGQLSAFNSSGDPTPFPNTFVNSAANATEAQAAANRVSWNTP